MSLLDAYTERLTLVTAVRSPDGEGGGTDEYIDSTEFPAAIAVDTKAASLAGESATETVQYSILPPRGVVLAVGDILRRPNGDYLRVTTGTADRQTPPESAINRSHATAVKAVIV